MDEDYAYSVAKEEYRKGLRKGRELGAHKMKLLLEAAIKTLNENLDLCDGNVCTLKDLRDAVAQIEPNWYKDPDEKTTWVTFWLETNSTFGLVDSPEKWIQKRKEWNSDACGSGMHPNDIYDLKSYDKSEGWPEFGSRREHRDGTRTLGEFFEANGMDTNIGTS
jgi:hypothetical protein